MAAAAKKHNSKRRKSLKKSLFCFFGGCFGISNKVNSAHQHGGAAKSAGRPLLVKIPIVKEIQIQHENQFISNKTVPDINSERMKMKEKQNPVLTGQTKRVEKQSSMALSNPTKLTHSVSLPLPPPPRQRTEKLSGELKGKTGREVRVAGEIDPIVGAVLIMVTLIVMVIWGKMCAVVCTAAWFYFLPRFTARMDNNRPIKLKTADHHLDLDSWEYKKNVVLRGLLDRK